MLHIELLKYSWEKKRQFNECAKKKTTIFLKYLQVQEEFEYLIGDWLVGMIHSGEINIYKRFVNLAGKERGGVLLGPSQRATRENWRGSENSFRIEFLIFLKLQEVPPVVGSIC